MNNPAAQSLSARRLAITVRGVVQGVGFRPFVYNAAHARGLRGWVQNEAGAVQIEVEGESAAVEDFVKALRHAPPPQARIEAMEVAPIPCTADTDGEFRIRPSGKRGAPGPTIPADLGTCAECLEEIRTSGERRYQYPFTNCTNCGPRWSIIETLPYDRPRTSMARFAMCPSCRSQYENPADRRFHAQPIACPECGPQLGVIDADGSPGATGQEALGQAARAILSGQTVALKGLGGFQLVCDATNRKAVALLRQRKRRPDKPFAVMLASVDEVRARCEVSDDEAATLQSPQAPILLLRRKEGSGEKRKAESGKRALVCDHRLPLSAFRFPLSPPLIPLAPEIAPGNPYLGVMLPYSPLHHLLMAAVGRPVVCTSGNLSEEPMAIATEDALDRLRGFADLFLVHDRPIVRPVDDSVARFGPHGLQLLRRARGYAPLPIDVGISGPIVLAVGGHLKNAVALSLGSQVVLSPHVGDLDNVLSVEVHQRVIEDLVRFFRVAPQVVACDLHPDYASTRHAEKLAAQWGVPLVRVQHHEAHLAACVAEHRLGGAVLGFSWDGTGYGTDGTVWGGEAIEWDGSGLRRLAHLRQFSLPGGDRAVREPRRSALGVLFEILGPAAEEHAAAWFRPEELKVLLRSLGRPRLSARTSSMGRLFDAVAALCGLPTAVSFEGQAAMALEYAADAECHEAYPLPLCVAQPPSAVVQSVGVPLLRRSSAASQSDRTACPAPSSGSPVIGDWEPMIRQVLADRAAGEPVARISARFHNALADWAVAVARRWGGSQVVLSGGCFQNALLTQRVQSRLAQAGFNIFTHRQVPPGDGGIPLGQVYYVLSRPR